MSNKVTGRNAQERTERGKVTEEEKGAEDNSCPFCDHNNGESDDMIQCDTCKMEVQYVCTNLPEYQLLAFISRSRKFECAKCINEEIKKKENEIKSLKTLLYQKHVKIKNSDISMKSKGNVWRVSSK